MKNIYSKEFLHLHRCAIIGPRFSEQKAEARKNLKRHVSTDCGKLKTVSKNSKNDMFLVFFSCFLYARVQTSGRQTLKWL